MQMLVVRRWVFVAVALSCGSAVAADKKADTAKEPPVEVRVTVADMSAHIEKALAERGEVAYLDTQLNDIVNDLELRYRLNIEIDGEALESEGKGQETTFSLMLKDVSLQSILNRLIKQHGLVWTVADEGIVITTPAGETKHLITTVYSVAELADADQAIDYDELSEMISQSVDPESWRSAGGPAGSISKVSAKKSLVITQTYTNHRAIASVLKQLAEK